MTEVLNQEKIDSIKKELVVGWKGVCSLQEESSVRIDDLVRSWNTVKFDSGYENHLKEMKSLSECEVFISLVSSITSYLNENFWLAAAHSGDMLIKSIDS